MVEGNRAHIIRRGLASRALLENETFVEAFEELMLETFSTFCAQSDGSPEALKVLWSAGQGMRLVKGKFETYVEEGKMEEVNKKHDERK